MKTYISIISSITMLYFVASCSLLVSTEKFLKPISNQEVVKGISKFNIPKKNNRIMDYSKLAEFSKNNGGIQLTFMGATFTDNKANILNTSEGSCSTALLAQVEGLYDLKIDTTQKAKNEMLFNEFVYPTLTDDITSFDGYSILLYWNTKIPKQLFESKKEFAIDQSKRVKDGTKVQILYLNTNVVK